MEEGVYTGILAGSLSCIEWIVFAVLLFMKFAKY